MTPDDRRYYDTRLAELSATVDKLEQSVTTLTAAVEKVAGVAETLEGLANAWINARGGFWIVKQVILCLAAVGAGVVGYKHIIELFK